MRSSLFSVKLHDNTAQKGSHIIMPKAKTPQQRYSHDSNCYPGRLLHWLNPDDCRDIHRSLKLKTSLHSDRYLDRWISNRLLTSKLKIKTISLDDMQGWGISSKTGNISHDSGRFFSITGVFVRHRKDSNEIEWDQPVIDQPEVGILGIITKEIDGILHFCLQAKEEPGNINSVQLSPTVQATFSNYTRVHGGTPPAFVEYFTDPSKGRIIYAKLQTEDAGRFLFKSNRNMIVKVGESELEQLPDGFIWATLRQIGTLMQRNNLMHACTRSILSALTISDCTHAPRSSIRRNDRPVDFSKTSLAETIQWLDNCKAANHFWTKRTPLNSLHEWGMCRDGSYAHEHGRFFRVIGINVASTEREVSAWNQPILDNPGTGVIGLLTKVIYGERFFLMQAKAEFGNRNVVQLGPTVQFTPENYIGNKKLEKPFLFEEFYKPGRFPLLLQSIQSEEGARFYNEAHMHRILSVPETEELLTPDNFRWISQAELNFFINMGENVNSCARSVLSLMLSLGAKG